MTHRSLAGQQSLLRIFLGDFDKYQHHALHKVILQTAREQGLAGCTVLRGSEGFGRSGRFHTGIELEGAGARPILLEIVDEPHRIEEFWITIEPWLSGALVTQEMVYVHYYETGASPAQATAQTSEETSMNGRELTGKNTLLRIYVGEADKVGHDPLHLELLKRARKSGLAGATSIHGMAGFGASSIVHTPHLLQLSSDLPVVIEIVDTNENIRTYLAEVAPLLQGALVTEESVMVHHYAARRKAA